MDRGQSKTCSITDAAQAPDRVTSSAFVSTESPIRYMTKLAKHFSMPVEAGPRIRAAHLSDHAPEESPPKVDLSDEDAIVDFGTGRCVIAAEPGFLALTAEADDAHALRHIQSVVAEHLERFGKRDRLRVHWLDTGMRTDAR